jgi:hypothetical protein
MRMAALGISPLQSSTASKWGLQLVCVGNTEGYTCFGPADDSDQAWLYRLSESFTAHIQANKEAHNKNVRIACHRQDWLPDQPW